MNVDRILAVFNEQRVAWLLIGGMNFLLRHKPVLTFDVDLWIQDTPANRGRCARALAELEAAWGPTEAEWRPVRELPGDWLARQSVFCLTSAAGPVDVFRAVRGLPDWTAAAASAVTGQTAGGVAYRGLSDNDMLRCQLALEPSERNAERVRVLTEILGATNQ